MQLKELVVFWGAVAAVMGLTAVFATGASTPAVTAAPLPVAIAPAEPKATSAYPPVKAADLIQHGNAKRLGLRSDVALVFDERDAVMLYGRNIDEPRPIASLTKLMTAVVVLDAGLPLNEEIAVTRDDRDRWRGSQSRLPFGTVLTREDLLRAALAASDNRAAAALARTYPGGTNMLVQAMNAKARALGLTQTRFADAAGLARGNVSTARDLAKLVTAIEHYPLIAKLSVNNDFYLFDAHSGKRLAFINTNRLVRANRWDVSLSKTGYTSDAGNCLVMRIAIAGRPLTIVLLNSWGKQSKYGDTLRIRDWIVQGERAARKQATVAAARI